MAFGQQSGPPATARQVNELLGLLNEAGHTDFRDARGPMGFTQRQAAGKFTRDEAEGFIEQLQEAADEGEGASAPMAAPAPRLSAAEQAMLSWSESDPAFTPDPALVEQLATEISDDDYETKVAGLLERSYQRDLKSDGAARDGYRKAYSMLAQGDHYLLVMIRRALGRHLRPWWALWR